jgi:hypothetical protein
MMNDEWERGSGRRGKGLHAKGAEDAERKAGQRLKNMEEDVLPAADRSRLRGEPW